MPTYRYLGDLPTVFISLVKDGHTFAPNKGDTIDWPVPIGHPLLELVVDEVPETKVGDVKTVVQEPEDESAAEEASDTTRSDS
jgi:hypothetical protein